MTPLLLLLASAAAHQDAAAAPASVPAVRARTNLADYFTQSWYPPTALRNREEGTVRFEVDVGRNGRAAACRIIVSSGSLGLDANTCAAMMNRARFTPARDAEGRRVPDRFVGRVQWALPPEAAEPAEDARACANLSSYVRNEDYPRAALARGEQGTVGFDLDVSEEGRVILCHVISSSGSEVLDLTTCSIMVERARFHPARDTQGNRVPDTVSARLTWRIW